MVSLILSDRPVVDPVQRQSPGTFSAAFPRGAVSMCLSSMHTAVARGLGEWGRAQQQGCTQASSSSLSSFAFLWLRQGSFRGGSSRSEGGRDGQFPSTTNRRRQYHARTRDSAQLLCFNTAPAYGVDGGDRGSRNNAGDWGNMQEGKKARVAREVAQTLAQRGVHLVLHFDLNKTLIMLDPAGGKSQKQVSARLHGRKKAFVLLWRATHFDVCLS